MWLDGSRHEGTKRVQVASDVHDRDESTLLSELLACLHLLR